MSFAPRDLAVIRISALINSGHLIEAKTKLDLLMQDPGSDVHQYPTAVRALYARIAGGGELPKDYKAYPSRKTEHAAASEIVGVMDETAAAAKKVDIRRRRNLK